MSVLVNKNTKFIYLLAGFAFLSTPPAQANECKDMAKSIVSLNGRVTASNVNENMRAAWKKKLGDMQADFAGKKCDPTLLEGATNKYNNDKTNSGK